MNDFDEDAYQDRMLNEYLDGLDYGDRDKEIEEYENAMCDKADAQRELDKENE